MGLIKLETLRELSSNWIMLYNNNYLNYYYKSKHDKNWINDIKYSTYKLIALKIYFEFEYWWIFLFYNLSIKLIIRLKYISISLKNIFIKSSSSLEENMLLFWKSLQHIDKFTCT